MAGRAAVRDGTCRARPSGATSAPRTRTGCIRWRFGLPRPFRIDAVVWPAAATRHGCDEGCGHHEHRGDLSPRLLPCSAGPRQLGIAAPIVSRLPAEHGRASCHAADVSRGHIERSTCGSLACSTAVGGICSLLTRGWSAGANNPSHATSSPCTPLCGAHPAVRQGSTATRRCTSSSGARGQSLPPPRVPYRQDRREQHAGPDARHGVRRARLVGDVVQLLSSLGKARLVADDHGLAGHRNNKHKVGSAPDTRRPRWPASSLSFPPPRHEQISRRSFSRSRGRRTAGSTRGAGPPCTGCTGARPPPPPRLPPGPLTGRLSPRRHVAATTAGGRVPIGLTGNLDRTRHFLIFSLPRRQALLGECWGGTFSPSRDGPRRSPHRLQRRPPAAAATNAPARLYSFHSFRDRRPLRGGGTACRARGGGDPA